jgi:hypothetical protein
VVFLHAYHHALVDDLHALYALVVCPLDDVDDVHQSEVYHQTVVYHLDDVDDDVQT